MQLPPLCYRIVSDEALKREIHDLASQMKALQPGSPEYEYDQLQLNNEKRVLEIREENPNLDPLTQDGERAIDQITSQDPTIQAISYEIRALSDAHPNECTRWGIPMYS